MTNARRFFPVILTLLFSGSAFLFSGFQHDRLSRYKTLNDSLFTPNDVIRLPAIHYRLGRCGLEDDSLLKGSDSLRLVLNFLKAHPELIAEIGQHSDDNCAQCDTKITVCRAQSCVDSLIRWGIPAQRLVAKGYSNSQPLWLIDDLKLPSGIVIPKGNFLTEKLIASVAPQRSSKDNQYMRMLNRRTELKILGTDYGK